MISFTSPTALANWEKKSKKKERTWDSFGKKRDSAEDWKGTEEGGGFPAAAAANV
jgi:hypothetical protein